MKLVCRRRERLRLVAVLGLLLGLVAGAWGVSVPSASGKAAGALTFEVDIPITYQPPSSASCPTGTPPEITCSSRTGAGVVRGLGRVEESYAYLLDESGCGQDSVRGLPSTARLTVPGKGEIDVRVSGTDCLRRVPPNPVIGTETFTVTGGSGKFAGASGGGTIAHVSEGPPAWRGRDTWTGTLTVPRPEFDLAPPVVSGAISRSVRALRRAKRVRVTYNVAATDDVDGGIPVSCQPRSGSRFRIGRTIVRCSATDSSANTATARFTIVVKRRR